MIVVASCGGVSETPGGSGGGDGDANLVAEGKQLYEQSCAACHGIDLQGTQTGPPFLSPIYAPDHHPDESFYAAVANGVEPHHWDFGPMPAQPNVGPDDVEAILAYVRSRQEEADLTQNGS